MNVKLDSQHELVILDNGAIKIYRSGPAEGVTALGPSSVTALIDALAEAKLIDDSGDYETLVNAITSACDYAGFPDTGIYEQMVMHLAQSHDVIEAENEQLRTAAERLCLAVARDMMIFNNDDRYTPDQQMAALSELMDARREMENLISADNAENLH